MKNFFILFFSVIFVSGLSLSQDTAQEVNQKPSGKVIVNGHGGSPIWEAPGAVLFDNGPLVNDPGGGFGGADRSFIESTLGHTLFGWGHQVLNNNAMADQFTVPAGEEWQIDELITFAYQTNAPTTSTITEVRAQIWDGDPQAGGTVIWGDHTTNIMTNTIWSNIYRTTDTDPLNSARAIMVQTSTVGTTLTEGTYWVHWMTNGSLASGPWCPPVTELGVAVTGDALQSLAGVFGPALNGTSPNGAPFILMGSVVGGGGYGLPEVLYYLFDEAGSTTTQNFAFPGSGSQFADVLGGLTMGPTGQFDNGLIGAGGSSSTDYVNTGWIPDLGTSDWTISLYLNNMPAGTALNYLFGGTVAVGWRCFYSGAAGQFGVLMRLTGIGGTDITVPGVGPGPSVLTFVYDSSVPTVYAYLNGVLAVTQPQAGALNMTGFTDNFKVGGYGSSAGMPAGSIMDEFRFYNRALDAAEVAATWNISVIPVELTSFSASVSGNNVELLWETATETNNSGFNIERKSANSDYVEVGFVPGFGTTTEPKAYSFEDNNLSTGTYIYRLKQIDFDGTFEYSDEVEIDVVAPTHFSLEQNYPNPFNPSTKITFSLAANSKVSLTVFDVLGQEVASLINQDLTAGVHSYDFNAAGFNSGVYFYRIEATGTDGAEFVDVKKMILVK